MKWLASIAVWCAALAALWLYCVRPMHCEQEEFDVQQITDRIAKQSADQVSLAPFARRNIQRLMPCIPCAPDVNRAMLLGANLRFVGRGEEAIAVYRDALLRDRRPELYLEIGMALSELGHDAEAVQYLIKACMYNGEFEDQIAFHHDEIKAAVDGYYTRIAAEAKKRSAR